MSARIDHAAEAQRLIDSAYSDDPAILDGIRAVAHAQLALVEQQRIANLIAAFQMEGGPYKVANNWTDGTEDANVRIPREIREALGLA